MGKIYHHYLQVPAASYHQYFLPCFSLTAPTEEWLLTIKILIFHLLKNIYIASWLLESLQQSRICTCLAK